MAEPKLVAPNVSPFGSVSPDGLLVSYVNGEGNLILREVHSGKEDQLTVRFANSTEYVGESVLSRDSRWIAFAHYGEDRVVELRMVGIDSLEARRLYRDERVKGITPCGWTPEGKGVLALIDGEAVMVPVEEGEPRRLIDFGGRRLGAMGLSPDGKWIAHDAGGRVVVHEIATGSERVVAEQGRLPVWMGEGWLLFQQDGRLMKWSADGVKVEREGFALARPWVVSTGGEFFYTRRTEKTELVVVGRDNVGPPEMVSTRFTGVNRNPVWGPDGRLVYWSGRGEGKWAVVVRDLSNNEERELGVKLATLEAVGWTANGKSLLVAGLDAKSGKRGWWRMDAVGGGISEVFAEKEFAGEGALGPAFLTADGKALFYARGGEVRVREIEKRTEERIAKGTCFAVSPNGRAVAVAEADRVVIYGGAGFADTVNVGLPGITELAWGGVLLAGKAPQLWTVDPGTGLARVVRVPRNRLAGVSAHPAGDRIAMAVGQTAADLFSVRVAVR